MKRRHRLRPCLLAGRSICGSACAAATSLVRWPAASEDIPVLCPESLIIVKWRRAARSYTHMSLMWGTTLARSQLVGSLLPALPVRPACGARFWQSGERESPSPQCYRIGTGKSFRLKSAWSRSNSGLRVVRQEFGGKLQAPTSALRPCICLCFVNAKAQRQRWLREGWDGPTLPAK